MVWFLFLVVLFLVLVGVLLDRIYFALFVDGWDLEDYMGFDE